MSIELSGGRRVVWNWGNLLRDDTCMRVVRADTGDLLCELRDGHSAYIRSGLELGDGRLLTWSNDKTLRVWELRRGRCEAVLEGHTEYVGEAHELTDGRILSWSGDRTLRIWDLRGGSRVLTLPGGIEHFLFKRELELLVLVEGDHPNVHVWSLGDDAPSASIPIESASGFVFLHDLQGALFAFESGSGLDTELHVWDAATRSAKCRLPHGWCQTAGLDGAEILKWQRERERQVVEFSIWNVETGSRVAQARIAGAAADHARTLADGRIAVWMQDFRLLVLDRDLARHEVLDLPRSQAGEHTRIDPSEAPRITDAELEEHVARGGPSSVTYAGPPAPGAVAGAGGVEHVATLRSVPTLLAAAEVRAGEVLLHTDQGFLLWRSGEERLRPCRAEDLPADASLELWSHNEHVPRTMVLEGGLVPNEDRSRLLPIEAFASPAAQGPFPYDAIFRRGSRLRVTVQGDLLSWDLEDPHSLALLPIDGRVLGPPQPVLDPARRFLQVEPFVRPDGCLFFAHGERFEPLLHPTSGEALRVDPSTRHFSVRHRWHADDRIALLRGRDIEIRSTTDGTLLDTLPHTTDGPLWGLSWSGPLLAWSRAELRSWNGRTLAPAFSLRDPAEWGAAREVVLPLRGGRLAYAAGEYSSDSRVVLWGGADALTVFHRHTSELAGLLELSDGSLLSWSSDGEAHQWRPAPEEGRGTPLE